MKSKQVFHALVFFFAALTACSNHDVKTADIKATDAVPFIHPPLKGVDVPFEHYSFLAEQGDTLFSACGSFLLFPPNSIVDKYGNPVHGKIDINYREFSDPVDFFVSGIP